MSLDITHRSIPFTKPGQPRRTGRLRIGICGMGGWAAAIRTMVLQAMRMPDACVQLVGVCDLNPESFPTETGELRAAGVSVVQGLDRLLELPIDAVWLPVPIPLHQSMTEAALRAGKAVICEKPAAASVDAVDAMIDARDRADLPVLIAFQDSYRPEVHHVRRRIASQEFGSVRSVSILGCWPRTSAYYARSLWAGRYQLNGDPVYDSPAMNAMAHFIQIAFFLIQKPAAPSPVVRRVHAELYRAYDIESFDTCLLKLSLTDQTPISIALTHACGEAVDPVVRVTCEHAVIELHSRRDLRIFTDGNVEHIDFVANPFVEILKSLASQSGFEHHNPLPGVSLEAAREHVRLCEQVSRHAPVHDIAPDAITIRSTQQGIQRAIINIEQDLARSTRTGEHLHDIAPQTYRHPGTRIDLRPAQPPRPE
jgi:predicted dehydrogenase